VYSFAASVSDNGSPSFSSTGAFRVVVREVNAPPEIIVPGNQLVAAQMILVLTNTAVDTDLPASALSFALLSGPTGSAVDAGSGVFTWQPTDGQAPGTNSVAVRVSDGLASDTGTFVVVVVQRPRLEIRPGGDGVVVLWPTNGAQHFSPRYSTNLTRSLWQAVTHVVSVTGNRYVFTNAPARGYADYRLESGQ
jgi:hypothetical protein